MTIPGAPARPRTRRYWVHGHRRARRRRHRSLLVGEATEDWAGDARYHEYSTAADPVGSGAVSPVPVARFPPDAPPGAGTRLMPLDLSAALGVPYPATGPALLAAFVVLEPGESLTTPPDATSELYHVLSGSGRTRVRARGRR